MCKMTTKIHSTMISMYEIREREREIMEVNETTALNVVRGNLSGKVKGKCEESSEACGGPV